MATESPIEGLEGKLMVCVFEVVSMKYPWPAVALVAVEPSAMMTDCHCTNLLAIVDMFLSVIFVVIHLLIHYWNLYLMITIPEPPAAVPKVGLKLGLHTPPPAPPPVLAVPAVPITTFI